MCAFQFSETRNQPRAVEWSKTRTANAGETGASMHFAPASQSKLFCQLGKSELRPSNATRQVARLRMVWFDWMSEWASTKLKAFCLMSDLARFTIWANRFLIKDRILCHSNGPNNEPHSCTTVPLWMNHWLIVGSKWARTLQLKAKYRTKNMELLKFGWKKTICEEKVANWAPHNCDTENDYNARKVALFLARIHKKKLTLIAWAN